MLIKGPIFLKKKNTIIIPSTLLVFFRNYDLRPDDLNFVSWYTEITLASLNLFSWYDKIILTSEKKYVFIVMKYPLHN